MMNRRAFLSASLAASVEASAKKRPPLCIFSKHMAQFDYQQLGKNAKQMGFDGVDLTVRAKGHVLPERAAADLPRAVEALRAHGLEVPMVTTGLTSAEDPAAKPILSTAARLGIPFWKPGYVHYDLARFSPHDSGVAAYFAAMGRLAKEHRIVCGFHNHSGNYVGAPVWDTFRALEKLEPEWTGFYYDPAHATIEGGLDGWRISQSLAAPRMRMVALKDFYWTSKGGQWRVQWCPLGEGMVNWGEVFRRFAAAGFAGPISLHVEYDPADELAAIAKDLEFMRRQVRDAYGRA